MDKDQYVQKLIKYAAQQQAIKEIPPTRVLGSMLTAAVAAIISTIAAKAFPSDMYMWWWLGIFVPIFIFVTIPLLYKSVLYEKTLVDKRVQEIIDQVNEMDNEK